MTVTVIRDLDGTDEYYVGTCTHVNESEEIDACARRRLAWLKSMYDQGLRVKVALHDGRQVGFLYVMPIEVCPWGPVGRDLFVIPCLVVQERGKGKGVGRALLQAAEQEAVHQGGKGLVTMAYYHDFWFMPASFFERCSFSAAHRKGPEAILWKALEPSAQAPRLLERNYRFVPVPGKAIVDLFWNTFCQTSDIEAQRVREVAAEFGDTVVLHDYCADDRETLLRHQTPRGIFVNGKEIGWGYEAPREGIREAIAQALTQK